MKTKFSGGHNGEKLHSNIWSQRILLHCISVLHFTNALGNYLSKSDALPAKKNTIFGFIPNSLRTV